MPTHSFLPLHSLPISSSCTFLYNIPFPISFLEACMAPKLHPKPSLRFQIHPSMCMGTMQTYGHLSRISQPYAMHPLYPYLLFCNINETHFPPLSNFHLSFSLSPLAFLLDRRRIFQFMKRVLTWWSWLNKPSAARRWFNSWKKWLSRVAKSRLLVVPLPPKRLHAVEECF